MNQPRDLHRKHFFIGGEFVDASGDERIDVISPFTEEVIGSIPVPTEAEATAALNAARKAFDDGPWPRMKPQERARALERIADALLETKDECAEVMSLDNGMPVKSSPGMGRSTDVILRSYADLARTYEFSSSRPWQGSQVSIFREPMGVVLAIAPWNGPVSGNTHMLAPALAAGCTIVLKPASEAPLSLEYLARAVQKADLPPGVVSVLPADKPTGEYLINQPQIDKIAFTGSTAVGRHIMEVAARNMVRVTLELGGKGPAVICDDVDLDTYADGIIRSGMWHSGQVCAAQTRLLVPASRHDEILDRLVDRTAALVVGDPMDPKTDIGPLTMQRQRTRVEEYIAAGRAEGAKVVLGGGRPNDLPTGWFVEPTIFDGVDNSMRIAQEEIFGPVLSVITYEHEDDAVKIANGSIYGLSGSVWTQDPQRAERLARRMQVGQVHVNGHSTCPGQPFGGFKQSGIGRKGGPEGLEAYLETKLVQHH
jgi:aldehyde dehydrogenase (NAD+)